MTWLSKFYMPHGLGDHANAVQVFKPCRDRGNELLIKVNPDREWLWRAAGYKLCDGASDTHPYWEPSAVNRDLLNNHPWDGNKSGQNLAAHPLPVVGSPAELWDEMVNHRFDLTPSVSEEAKGRVARWIDDLPRPLFLLHTRGATSPQRKNYPPDLEVEVVEQLLQMGSVVYLTWDRGGPETFKSARYRVLGPSVEELYWMTSRADVFLGIDSGPYHLARMTGTPRVGVWFDIPAWHACIPSPDTVNLVRPHGNNPYKRFDFNMVQVPRFSGESVARHVKRIVAPRKLSPQVGTDIVLQSLVEELGHKNATLSNVVDRNLSVARIFEFLRDRQKPQVLETGCIRSVDDWGAGWFTALCGYMLKSVGGHLVSVDYTPKNCDFARLWTGRLPVTVVESDSVQFLDNYAGPKLDVIYLDSMDTDVPGHQEHCLAEARAAVPHLKDDGLLVIDDSPWDGEKWVGKGGLAIPWLLERGWRHVFKGYQSIFARPA